MDIVTQTCLLFILVTLIITIPVCAQRFHLVGESYLLASSVLFLGVAYLLDWGIASPAKNYVLVIFGFQATFALALFVKKLLVGEWSNEFIVAIDLKTEFGSRSAYIRNYEDLFPTQFTKASALYVLFILRIWLTDNNLSDEYGAAELEKVPKEELDEDSRGTDLYIIKFLKS